MVDSSSLPPISTELALTPISHFMSRKVIYATPSTTIRHAMEMMINHKISGLVVVDESETVLGVYSELDAMLQGAGQKLDGPITYSKPAKTIPLKAPFRDVLLLLVKYRVKRFPVVDDRKKLMGVVSRRDLMKAIFKDISNVRN